MSGYLEIVIDQWPKRYIHDAINILTLKKRLYNLELTEKLPNNLVLQIKYL